VTPPYSLRSKDQREKTDNRKQRVHSREWARHLPAPILRTGLIGFDIAEVAYK
jgi:hypothetical protein